tara:strand:+ start:511 stop:930 length:420 start_codon:yes stop_codon:yes gene_type:complete
MTNSSSKSYNYKENCYTCFKNRKKNSIIDQYVIYNNPILKYEIHKDIRKRPIIIVTPHEHVSSLEELEPLGRFSKIIKSVKQYLKSRGVDGFKITISDGNWQRHDHLHIKFELEADDIKKVIKGYYCTVCKDIDSIKSV